MFGFCLVRRLRSRDSTEDLLDISRRQQERGMAMNANENQFFPPISFQDHHSAHVNPALIGGESNCVRTVHYLLFQRL